MSRKWKRIALVTIGDKQFAGRVSFKIEQKREADACKGTVSLFNLNDDTRNYMERTLLAGGFLRLDAGYIEDYGTIFIGKLVKPKNERQGPDIVTVFECVDSGKRLADAWVDLSFDGPTPVRDVFQTIVNAMGIDIGYLATFPNGNFSEGYCFSGTAREALSYLCAAYGMEWFLRNGALTVLPKLSGTQEVAVKISPSTGMIGVPTKSIDNETPVFMCNVLLEHGLYPGRKVMVESSQADLNGTYICQNVTHEGDTYDAGGKFQTQIEALPS